MTEFYEMERRLVARSVGCIRTRLPPGIERQDLYQAGMLALLEAEPRYDESVGASLETFLWNRVYGAMLDEIRHARPGTRYSTRPVMLGIDSVTEMESREKPLYEQAMDSKMVESLREAVRTLSPRLRAAIDMHYQDGFLLRDVGEALGVSESRACNIMKEALDVLRIAMARWVN